MQSYMNSLNESASMEIDSSPPPEAPSSPDESPSEEAIGAISQAYRNIFVNEEKEVKPVVNNNNNNNNMNNNATPSGFHGNNESQDSNHPQARPHAVPQQNYHRQPVSTYHPNPARCPVTHRDNATLDNSHYTHPVSSNQGPQCPGSQNYSANQNSHPINETQAPSTCPFRLGGGAKVLVSDSKRVCVCLCVCVYVCV